MSALLISARASGLIRACATAAIVYGALGALGISFAIAPGYASPIFPAAGFAVAMLLRCGKAVWPGIWIGSLFLNLGTAWLHGDLGWRGTLVASGIACGATLQALTAWWLVKRQVKDSWQTMEVERDILVILALAGPLACVLSASVGVSVLYAAHLVFGTDYLYALLSWWVGDVLGVLVLLPLSLAVMYRKRAPWQGRLATLGLPMLVVLGLVASAFSVAARWEHSRERQIIEHRGEALAQLLAQRFIAHQAALSALRRLAEVTPDMGYAKFEYFTDITLKDNPDISALSINPYVLPPQRQAFERSMATRTGVKDFEIKERDSQRRLVRAADRPDYVAVGYIAPLAANLPAVGFDINSDPVRHAAIERAKASREPVVTAPIQLVQENQKHVGVLLLHPAYPQGKSLNEAKALLMGFAVGVINIDKMVKIATQSVVVGDLAFRLDDAQGPAGQTLLYVSDATAPQPDNDFLWKKQLVMADRTWTLSVYPKPEFLQNSRHLTTMMVGAGGLALAALLQILLLGTTGRTAIVQRKVKDQTAELLAKSDALQDQNAQLSALFSLSPDGFVAFSHDGKVKFVNPSFETMTGIDEAALIGKDEEVLNAELRTRSEVAASFTGIASCFSRADDGLVSMIVTLKTPRHVVLQMVGIRSESSSVARILYFRDVTSETEVDQMKSEFLSTAAHELRTPMASIYGFSEVLLQHDLDEASRTEFLGIIYRQSEWMVSILNELLDLSRIESRRGKDFVFEPTHAQDLIALVVSGFKLPAGRSMPTLVMPNAPLYMLADHSKAHQAILNVLSNAYKYSPAGGGVDIELVQAKSKSGLSRVGVRITDVGIGMTPAQTERVFERFYRADTSGAILGTGLGMSIVKEIVELHGGEVDIASQVGVGTSVTLWIPAS